MLPDADPVQAEFQQLRQRIQNQQETVPLTEKWDNFWDESCYRNLMFDSEAFEAISNPEKLQADCEQHVKELLEAKGRLSLDACIQKARDVNVKTCLKENREKR